MSERTPQHRLRVGGSAFCCGKATIWAAQITAGGISGDGFTTPGRLGAQESLSRKIKE